MTRCCNICLQESLDNQVTPACVEEGVELFSEGQVRAGAIDGSVVKLDVPEPAALCAVGLPPTR